MALTNDDTINGVPISKWLQDRDWLVQNPKDTFEPTNPEPLQDKHFLYKKSTERFPVKNGRSGKPRALTLKEIRKEYPMEVLPHKEKLVHIVRTKLEPDIAYHMNDVFAMWYGLPITKKSFSPLWSVVCKALGEEVGSGHLRKVKQKGPKGNLYFTTPKLYTSTTTEEQLNEIIRERLTSDARDRKTRKKGNVQYDNPNKKIIQKVKGKVGDVGQETTLTIPSKIKVDVTVKILFGFIKE